MMARLLDDVEMMIWFKKSVLERYIISKRCGNDDMVLAAVCINLSYCKQIK